MSPVTKIAMRQIKKSPYRTALIMLSVFFSMAVVSLFIFFEAGISTTRNPEYKDLPFTEFIKDLGYYMNITVGLLLLITLITVRVECAMKNEENEKTLAVLSSVGASASDKRRLVFINDLLIYLPPVIFGTAVGIFPGIRLAAVFNGVSVKSGENIPKYILTAVVIISVTFLFVVALSFLPSIAKRDGSVIQKVRAQNKDAIETRHGYRESYTYRSQAPIKKLAKKSIDYYRREYTRISFSFALSALYPIISLLLFFRMGSIDVTFDTNPYDGVDTAEAVEAALNNIFLFLGVAFLVLFLMGILQSLLISRIQTAARKRDRATYLSVGLSGEDFDRLLGLEIRNTTFKTVIILIFASLIVSVFYSI